jgi:hypothetical protein
MRYLPHAVFLCLTCILTLHGQENPITQSARDAQDAQASEAGQQKPPDTVPPADPSAAKPGDAQTPGAKPADPKAVDKRVFGVIPNNRTTSGAVPFTPITAKRKLIIGLKDSFDWPPYLTAALFAGLYQLEDSNPSFGQGTVGYFHRFATASADQVIGNMMTEALIPAAFHQDPRYFMLGPGNGTRKHRLWHAVNSILVAPMDSGRKTFNFSEWGGNAAATAISNAYYPDNRTAGDNTEKWLVSIATDTFSNVMKEFWPDVKQWWTRKHSHSAPPGVVAH